MLKEIFCEFVFFAGFLLDLIGGVRTWGAVGSKKSCFFQGDDFAFPGA